MTDTGPPRLDQAMRDELLRADLTWKRIAELAGMTEYHLQRIRSGKTRLTERAAAKIDRAMGWELGSARLIYDEGAQPTPLRLERSAPAIPEGVLVDPADWAVMTPQQRADYVKIVSDVHRRRRQASRGS